MNHRAQMWRPISTLVLVCGLMGCVNGCAFAVVPLLGLGGAGASGYLWGKDTEWPDGQKTAAQESTDEATPHPDGGRAREVR